MKTGPKHGNILGIQLNSTNKVRLLSEIHLKLENKEKFYIVTPNPEIVLMATKDWLLKKAILRSTFSVPDGIGLKFAFKFLNNENIEVIKGRELFLDILKIANEMFLRVYFMGGENNEAELAANKLKPNYPNITFKTYHKFPKYTQMGQPASENDKNLHRKIIGNIKLFEANLIFVGMTPPKQEKWIYRNIYRMKGSPSAMTVGGTFRYIAGMSKLPPKWLASLGLEWLWRVVTEPKRIIRIWNAVIVFSARVVIFKLFK
ncbi:MAG: N-acetylglucosaminyldiphosphoundecaprenol N-acetyl-beta-D-mannosaminyltransferase [Candidatus Woesebacteria bacterium GW2011_GWA1_33_30]|uniref:N-acetylglucosaminyldiphosphoundecaprenol N-acetyl-beta-D-mannosaminyltransferase n=1 Tax=Candidatus Woesebacteria bacterium GW2011_GWA2_33_28 TaxID=1618561 RepID=A0A0G0C6M1_9BACT|nr:MAG: N-acetylglucosaminyldiphosphoundecaprenol N-acetyl-beta-D-mannosaminyltransferase [Candidatus Woesebacteria bacterium GW2011_GWA2_33_28]KKP47800.1 MAG: N-acetylglucosaminyldiphosphoundecaprenol N-acetyl-beta-D-mannosaminyltransferase [Candidatus Woesebacteria bacterium GW2011_GWA1_33_30]KKP49245.1 MAG: UDP-N-acetyl-D-mannosamine transferase [Microgenomates group bacterium GW2011_GWC1_33_32]KKP51612.1 MAG: N-acetylglucosaminyldiphosphoundecaprenol N-acetyl-beta-D-mannosaminyltransferase [